MDAGVSASEVVPRYADLALFLCGTALRNVRLMLPSKASVTLELQTWYLRKVCFLHTLPNDDDDGLAKLTNDEAEDDAAWGHNVDALNPSGCPLPASSSSADTTSALFRLPPVSARAAAREVNFRSACARLSDALSNTPEMRPLLENEEDGDAAARAQRQQQQPLYGASTAGHVHPRTPSETPEEENNTINFSLLADTQLSKPSDVGFALLEEFLLLARSCGGAAVAERLAAALVDVLVEHTAPQGTPAAELESRTAPPATFVSVSTLSRLFEEDLLNDDLSVEAGNATRSFHIWVNYEWASASFARQAKLAKLSSRWLRALYFYRSGEAWRRWEGNCQQNAKPVNSASAAPQRAALPVQAAELASLSTNLKAMDAALECVFEGHTTTHKLLMELALLQRGPHVTDNALAKLLFLQGPSVSSGMARAELSNRGTQPILTCITSGMLLYAQYYLSLQSLAVARQCVRVALQVAQEVHSNSLLALAHYTAHVVAVHQNRPADAANSISIALRLTLQNAASSTAVGGVGVGEESAPTSSSFVDGQMASVAFTGAAQLLLFFPGAVGAALRSVLSTGRLGSSADAFADDTNAPASSSMNAASGNGGLRNVGGGGGDAAAMADGGGRSGAGAVSVQTIAQSLQHALLRAETSLLHTLPAEGQWVHVVAALHRETLKLIGGLYGIVSSPRQINVSSLKTLIDSVDAATAVGSPLFALPARRSLFWEVVRHSAYQALCTQEHLLTVVTLSDNNATPAAASTRALTCLHDALEAVRTHYGVEGLRAATENIFFASVVSYCAACRLQEKGCAAAAYSLLSTVADRLGNAAGMENSAATASSPDFSQDVGHRSRVNTAERTHAGEAEAAGIAASCWSPDNLFLFAVVQRRRAEVAAFLGLVSAVREAQQLLLAVSARFFFVFGVLTAQVMDGQAQLHSGRYAAALEVARRVEHSALRIGVPCIVEAACALQVSAYSSSGHWACAQRVLLRFQPRRGSCTTRLLLHKFSVHVELLLQRADERAASTLAEVRVLTRSWLKVLQRERLISSSGDAVAGDVELPLMDKLCLLSTLHRALQLLGAETTNVCAATTACLRELEQRQTEAVPDVYLDGDCEEIVHFALQRNSTAL